MMYLIGHRRSWRAQGTLHCGTFSHFATVLVSSCRAPKGHSHPQNGPLPQNRRPAATAIASHLPADRAQLAFVNRTAQEAFATLDRVASVATYAGTVAYPNNGFALALRTVAGAMVRGVGTKVFWVQTGGYDTHSGQGAAGGGAYATLMGTFGDGLLAFYNDLRNQGLLNDTLVLQYSEFGRRISENGSGGTDHGAAGIMMALGGSVRGGLYGTSPVLSPGHPTLENASASLVRAP